MKVTSLIVAIFGLMSISIAQNNGSDSSYWSNNKIMKGGFFLDGNLGYMRMKSERYYAYEKQTYYYKNEGLGVGVNIGQKIYFGQSETHRHGISISGGFDIYMNQLDFFDHEFVLSPLNLGFTNIFKTSSTQAIEVNLNSGPVLSATQRRLAIKINPEVRFRMKRLTLGLGYSYDLPITNSYYKVLSTHRVNLIIGIR